ncbi:hypothetical protein [Flavobacterium sp.]|uniref:hypothetical protein n=2 Tax=Flavobacterium sp. TaxID=239 RepID=UPI004047527B
MKKMIFSAVALIAFSFAGMANEVEVQGLKRVPTDCEIYAYIATTLADEQHTMDTGTNWDEWTIDFVYATILDGCNNQK